MAVLFVSEVSLLLSATRISLVRRWERQKGRYLDEEKDAIMLKFKLIMIEMDAYNIELSIDLTFCKLYRLNAETRSQPGHITSLACYFH